MSNKGETVVYTPMKTLGASIAALAAFGLAACSTEAETSSDTQTGDTDVVRYDANPFPSTYEPFDSGTTLLTGATVFDGIGGQLENTDILIEDGRIAQIGQGLTAPDGAHVIDAAGRFITPGVVDIHSYLGVYPSPSVNAH